MKTYEFDLDTLVYRKLTFKKFIKRNYISWIIGGIVISCISISIFKLIFLPNISLSEVKKLKPQYEKIMLLQTPYEFTEDKFIAEIERLNLKYPHIVYAQAMLESGNFNSKIFRENHNMFGMKQARSRINLAEGTQHSHAYFKSWKECLYDFAFYRATYLSKLKTENDYYQYLGKYYAQDPGYASKLKVMVNKHKLKNKFK